jgi:thiamine-monophosphate kinase
VALGQALRGVASAAIDVSDGLVGDLGHILERSGVGATVDADALPASAVLAAQPPALRRECGLAGGDDYELLFTAPKVARERVAAFGQAFGVRLTRIGNVTPPGSGLVVRAESGDALSVLPRAFDHFAAPATGPGGRG